MKSSKLKELAAALETPGDLTPEDQMDAHETIANILLDMADSQPPSFFIVTFTHKHGVNTWPVWSQERPTEDEIKADLEDQMDEGEWNRMDTYLDITGPFGLPAVLTTSIEDVLSNADNEGCSDDLTVTSHSAVEALRSCMRL